MDIDTNDKTNFSPSSLTSESTTSSSSSIRRRLKSTWPPLSFFFSRISPLHERRRRRSLLCFHTDHNREQIRRENVFLFCSRERGGGKGAPQERDRSGRATSAPARQRIMPEFDAQDLEFACSRRPVWLVCALCPIWLAFRIINDSTTVRRT